MGLTGTRVCPVHAADPGLPTLTNLQQIVALGLSGALESTYPVRVRGVVVFPSRSAREMLHLSDGTNGVAVTFLNLSGLRLPLSPSPKVGDLIEVTGETGAGASHPYIIRATARILGPGRFEEPVPVQARDIMAGRHHGRLVRLRATVLDVSRQRGGGSYLLQSGGHGFYAAIGEPVDPLPLELLNASVELQGMPWIQFDGTGKATGFRFLVGSNAWVRVIKPGSSNRFAGPRMTLAAVSNAPLSTDRVVVSGVVTYAWSNQVVAIEDATGAALAYPLQPIPKTGRESDHVWRPPRPALQPGDRIELVASHYARRAYAPALHDTEYQVIGRESLPTPPLITEADALTGLYDGRRVRIQGRVLDRDSYEQAGSKVSRLWVKCGDLTSHALIAGSQHAAFPAPAGSRVELTGLCVVSAGTERPVRTFTLHLNGPDDVRALPEPSWWANPVVQRVATTTGIGLALALGWVWLLRRQVARQTAALRASNERLQSEARERASAEADRAARLELLALNAEVALALNETPELRAMLQRCAEILVQHLDAAFARIWTLNESTQTLELEASAGLYTHLNGPHSRVPVGQYKIGLIALEKQPHLTNDVTRDARVSDREWAHREGMVAFAGYPLLFEGRVLGVVAVFARHPFTGETLRAFGAIANSLALGLERKRAETRLRDSEERFSRAFQSSSARLAILDAETGRYLDVNDAFVEGYGHTREDALGRTSLELGLWQNPDDRAAAYAIYEREGRLRGFESRMRTRSGEARTVLQSGDFITVGGRRCILSVGIDITDRKEAEAELHRNLARERELNELKSRFVAMVSHEFRTPLEIIVSSADILDRYLVRLPVEERAEHLAAIQHSVKRMSGMMEDVLLLGRFESTRQQFRPDDIHITALCRRIADEIRSATGGACPLTLSIPDDLPLARADESLIRHILSNLLSNAVKYSPAGSPVRLSLTRDGVNAVFRIEDTGLGIPAADQVKLFESFHRGRNTAQIPGTGLGLVIVKRSVDLHAGRIEFTSEEGTGTTFTVWLPVFQTGGATAGS